MQGTRLSDIEASMVATIIDKEVGETETSFLLLEV